MRTPRENVLPDQFQAVAAEDSRPWSRFVCSYMQSTRSSNSAIRHVYLGCSRGLYTRSEKVQYQNKIKGKMFGISAIISPVNTLDHNITEAYLKVCEIFTDSPMCLWLKIFHRAHE